MSPNTPCRFCRVPMGEHVSGVDGTARCSDGRGAQPVDEDVERLHRSLLEIHRPVDLPGPRRSVARYCAECTRQAFPCPTASALHRFQGRSR